MANEYRIVFTGRLREGFELTAVKQAAALRLKASAAQIEKLFSGHRAVLKKGLDPETAKRYVDELFHLGMMARAEAMPVSPPLSRHPAEATEPTASSSDLEKTQLADPDALTRYLTADAAPPATPSPQDSTVAPHQAPEDASAAPTLIVPRDKVAEAARLAREATLAIDPSSAPTLIVPRASAERSAPSTTVIVEQGLAQAAPTLNPEQTLLANADRLADYFAASIEPPPAAPSAPAAFAALPTAHALEAAPAPVPEVAPLPPPPSQPHAASVPAEARELLPRRPVDATEWVAPQGEGKTKRKAIPSFFALSAQMQLLVTVAVGCIVILILLGLNSLG